MPGFDYDVRSHALGSKYSPSVSIDLITTKEIASQTGKGRGPLRHVITWQEKEDGKVKANAYSDIIPGVGWQSLALNFTADADGILTVEADAGVEPENPQWVVVKTINVTANQPVVDKFEIYGSRYRISFSATAKILAVAYLAY